MKKWWFLSLIVGTLLIYVFWPSHNELPNLKSVDPFVAENLKMEEYHFDNDKVKVVAFFYTNCPDICLFTFVDLQELQDDLQTRNLFGDKVEIVTITLDPEVDTNERLVEYSHTFGVDPTGWQVLRTSLLNTKEIADDFQMTFKKVSGDFMAHRTTMFLVDSNNQIRATYSMADSSARVDLEKIKQDINSLLNE